MRQVTIDAELWEMLQEETPTYLMKMRHGDKVFAKGYYSLGELNRDVRWFIDNIIEDSILEFVGYSMRTGEYLRRCSICGKFMDEGYYCQGDGKYYCSDECLHHDYTDEEYKAQYSEDDPDCCFWTEW